MEKVQESTARASRYSTSLYPIHATLIHEIRLKRGKETDGIPGAADVVQEAIVRLAAEELDRERFEQLMAGAA